MAAGDGLISMKPTSITHAGTAASINADGGVDFTAVTSLSLNGVFTGDYDNYLIVINDVNSTNTQTRRIRLRDNGTDETGAYFTQQYLLATSTSVSGGRTSGATYLGIGVTSLISAGVHVAVYGPNLSEPTAFRTVDVHGESNARLMDFAGTHSLSTAYDGFTFFPVANTITGTVHVFGYEE